MEKEEGECVVDDDATDVDLDDDDEGKWFCFLLLNVVAE